MMSADMVYSLYCARYVREKALAVSLGEVRGVSSFQGSLREENSILCIAVYIMSYIAYYINIDSNITIYKNNTIISLPMFHFKTKQKHNAYQFRNLFIFPGLSRLPEAIG